jgi:hypothetical protein
MRRPPLPIVEAIRIPGRVVGAEQAQHLDWTRPLAVVPNSDEKSLLTSASQIGAPLHIKRLASRKVGKMANRDA